MKVPHLSVLPQEDISDIEAWYSATSRAIQIFFSHIIDGSINDDAYMFLSREEVVASHREVADELDQVAMFQMLSHTEGRLRQDFYQRARGKRSVPLAREFREIANTKKPSEISVENHILDLLQEQFTEKRSVVSAFRGAMNYRHWFAHGRYYRPQLGQKYDVLVVARIAREMLAMLE